MTALLPKGSGRGANGLPAEVTGFVGRRHELAEIKRLLTTAHVITLTGVGGVGKSRLALRAAVDMRRAFPGGVWLAELADLENPELVVEAVAKVVGIQDHSARPGVETLVEGLTGRQALIVLDNCEHLLTACAVLADRLVHALPQLRILTTTRQPLGIAGEQTLDVAPLPLPGEGGTPAAEQPSEGDAVRLFEERAAAVLPDFAVTEANRDAVAEICRKLDGLPLAIELAAVRLRALSVDQVLERLDDRFRLLTAGSRAGPHRQRTLRALIDWSYELCDEQERLLWQRTSVFLGGLDLGAAEEVCSGDGISRTDVVDLVSGLVEKSVLIREEQGGSVRYRLLDTIRQYGRERLAASGQETGLRRRHRDHYRSLAERARCERFGPGYLAWISRLDREHANLRTALEWCLDEPGEALAGLEMASDLLYHWITSSRIGEGRHWLDQLLATGPEPTPQRARALWTGAWLAVIQNDLAPAAAMLEEGRRIAERFGLRGDLAYIAHFSGQLALAEDDSETAVKFSAEAVEAQRALGDPEGLVTALIWLSLAYSARGEAKRAVSYAEEAVAVCEAYQEGWHRAYALMALGVELRRQGALRRAADLEKDGLRINRAVRDVFGSGMNMEVLAWIAADEGRFQRSARLLGFLERIWQALGTAMSSFLHLAKYHDECRARTVEALGEPAFRAEARNGAGLTFDEAIVYALQEERPKAEREPAGGPTAPLTRRETEIAELVAQGLSNRDIASSLVISQRTAEGHIEHILNKLGFNSRTQIAAWLSERRRGEDR
ncbi:LuxR family transcriptional regulator [Microbispora sp. RL4-1S]|uniref:LuxR family transcriptional regulator n=1 Tax=Microbispora oryzae TaxID=2806554 RepID=A0A940WQ06_9ACTN|nr:LuxR C-terminal-related transcriptional regulator [Microbispora oryzae]MBP2707452.1 LuxR family transcriptional regulator [Microbispora oryzae]